MALADAFVGLPIESLILDPLLSAAKGQAALAQVTLDFVEALAFEESDGKDNTRKAKLLDIDLDRLANKPDGSMTHLSQKVQMPLLPLVTIPNFSLSEMTIDFMMEVKTSESSSTTDSSSDTSSSSVGTDTSASLSYGFWGVKGSVSTSVKTENKTSGTVSSSKDTQRSSDQSAKYHINVKAIQNPPAEGMDTVPLVLFSVLTEVETDPLTPQNP